MKTIGAAFLSGLLFATGLCISGMTHPANIVGFLDFLGDWKPALIFVMAGALGTYAVLYPFVRKRHKPLFSLKFDVSNNKTIDASLVVGAITFGIGWGVGGFCPGPAMVSLGTGASQVIVFVISMLFGVLLHRVATSGNSNATNDSSSCG
jgi:uncharacterized membrane protein YedE/YeeE